MNDFDDLVVSLRDFETSAMTKILVTVTNKAGATVKSNLPIYIWQESGDISPFGPMEQPLSTHKAHVLTYTDWKTDLQASYFINDGTDEYLIVEVKDVKERGVFIRLTLEIQKQ